MTKQVKVKAIPNYYGGEAWLPTTISRAAKKLRESGIEFDSIAVRGVSGIVFGAKLAHVMKKNLVVVRKPNESSHADSMVEGLRPSRYIFVDDFISTGRTKHAVVYEISMRNSSAELVGSYLYKDEQLSVGG